MNSKDTFFSKKTTLNCGGKLVDLTKPKIMGVLNVTPDSFFDGGRYLDEDAILNRIERLMQEGADILDVGACSTRPGAAEISPEEERKRLTLALKPLRKRFPHALVSVDTYRSSIARWAVTEFRTDMVNDISAGMMDPMMIETIAEIGVPYVMMHMQGTPATMQVHPTYEDPVREIVTYFSERLSLASSFGMKDVIIDPGFGFGKTLEHNFLLLNKLDVFAVFEQPVMVGLSRKSMIYRTLNTTPEESLNGTTVLNTMALLKGANILRVHDVKQAREAVRLFLAYQGQGMSS